MHPQTAYRWFREGMLPVPTQRVGPRTILATVKASALPDTACGLGLYDRVSSHDQRSDLERQVARLTWWAGEVEDDLVRDMAEVLTSFCARLHGRWSAKSRAKRALEAAGHG